MLVYRIKDLNKHITKEDIWNENKHEKMLAHWKKSYDQPRQCIKKQRHHFASEGHIVNAVVFPVVRYGCESWTIKKAER